LSGEVRGFCFDTRNDCSGMVFVAIEGSAGDGHDYLPEAVDSGAAALIVAERHEEAAEADFGIPVFRTKDTVRALQELATAHRADIDPRCIAVTGTVGKTETKELTASMLKAGGKVHSTPGNYNNHVGLPLTILGMESGTDILVAEMGANHKGEIRLLCEIAKPDIGIVTNIGPGHLEYFGSLKGVASAKSELPQSLTRDGTAVLPADDDFFEFLAGKTQGKVVSFGFSEGAHWRPEEIVIDEDGSSRFNLRGVRMRIHSPGRYHILNVTAAAAAASLMGASLSQIAEEVESFRAVERRGRKYEVGGIIFLNDSYNSNPMSLQASIEAFTAMKVAGRRWLVLGDMLELGSESAELHREAGKMCGKAGVYGLMTIGDETVELNREAAVQSKAPREISHFIDMETLSKYINDMLEEGDAVLIKGSRNMQMWRLIDRIEELRGTERKRVD